MRYELDGNWYTINELAEKSGIAPHTIRDRMRRGYSIGEAIKIVATHDSIKEFCEASYWKDWVGMPIDDLFQIYWKWCVSGEVYTPLSKQTFSRQILQKNPMLKSIPTKCGERYCRVLRERTDNG